MKKQVLSLAMTAALLASAAPNSVMIPNVSAEDEISGETVKFEENLYYNDFSENMDGLTQIKNDKNDIVSVSNGKLKFDLKENYSDVALAIDGSEDWEEYSVLAKTDIQGTPQHIGARMHFYPKASETDLGDSYGWLWDTSGNINSPVGKPITSWNGIMSKGMYTKVYVSQKESHYYSYPMTQNKTEEEIDELYETAYAKADDKGKALLKKTYSEDTYGKFAIGALWDIQQVYVDELQVKDLRAKAAVTGKTTGLTAGDTVTVKFSEAMNTETLNAENFYLTDGTNTVAVKNVTVNGNDEVAVAIPDEVEVGVTYTLVAKKEIQDASGDRMNNDKKFKVTMAGNAITFEENLYYNDFSKNMDGLIKVYSSNVADNCVYVEEGRLKLDLAHKYAMIGLVLDGSDEWEEYNILMKAQVDGRPGRIRLNPRYKDSNDTERYEFIMDGSGTLMTPNDKGSISQWNGSEGMYMKINVNKEKSTYYAYPLIYNPTEEALIEKGEYTHSAADGKMLIDACWSLSPVWVDDIKVVDLRAKAALASDAQALKAGDVITVKFSEDMDTESFTAENVYFKNDQGELAAENVSNSGDKTMLITVPNGILPNEDYTLVIKKEVKDASGDRLNNDKTFAVKTKKADFNLISTEPKDNAKNVELDADLKLEFDKAIDYNSEINLKLTDENGNEVALEIDSEKSTEKVLSAKITDNLKKLTTYTAEISGIKSVDGEGTGRTDKFTFKTKGGDLTEVYASRKNIYLTFDSTIDQYADVKITDIDGNNVKVAPAEVQDGNVLRLDVENDLEIGKYYCVVSGKVKKIFRIVELLKDDFSDNSYLDSLDYYRVGYNPNTLQARVGIVNEKLFMRQRYVSYFTIKDGIVDKLKNYTVEFDMESYGWHCEGIMFNKTKKDAQYKYGSKTEGIDEIAWGFEKGNNKLKRIIRTDETTETFGKEVATVVPSTQKLTYSAESGIGFEESNTENPIAPKAVNYRVDKMGKTGVLSLDNSVKDVYSQATIAETGYFFIGSIDAWNTGNEDDKVDGRGFSLDNILVTTCEEMNPKISVAEVTVKDSSGKDITDIYGKDAISGKITVTNKTQDEQRAQIIAAVYGKGKLMKAVTVATELISSESAITKDYNISGISGADQLRVFVWEDTKDILPLAVPYNMGESREADFGDEIVIGFIGGSLTEGGAIWRNGVTDFFKEKYPDKTITAYSAGIGGTGSDMGAYRYERDILSYNPDIVFIDFAVNDTGKTDESSMAYMENMVKRSINRDKVPYMVFLYTPQAVDKDSSTYKSWKKGVDWKEEIATHYGIKSINIYDYMYEDYETQKKTNSSLTFHEYLGNSGYYLSGTSYNVHGGYEKYKEAILKELNNDFEGLLTKPKDNYRYCTTDVVYDNYEYIEVDSERLIFDENWTKYTSDNKYSGNNDAHKVADKDFSYPYFPKGIIQTETQNASFTFTTKPNATGVMISNISSTAGATATVYVDGEKAGSFTCYSIYDKMNYTSGWVEIKNDGNTHEVKVVTDGISGEKTVFRFGAVIERTVN